MNLISKYKFQIIALMLFAFIFYSGCTTTDVGRVKQEDIHNVAIDSFYYAVTRTNDTINLANTSAKLKKGEDSIDDVITYKISDTATANKIVKMLKTSDLKSLYAKYTHATTGDQLATIGIIVGSVIVVFATLLIILMHNLENGKGFGPH